MLSNGFVSKYFRSVFDIEYTIDFSRTYIYIYIYIYIGTQETFWKSLASGSARDVLTFFVLSLSQN